MKKELLEYCDKINIKFEDTCLEILFNLYNQSEDGSGFIYDLFSDRCIYIAPSIEKITGHICEDFHDKGILYFKSLIHPTDYSEIISEIVTFIRTEEGRDSIKACDLVKSLSFKMKHKKGSWIYLNVHVIRINKEDRVIPDTLIGFVQKSDYLVENEIPLIHKVTTREKEVLQLIASGDSTKIIAQKLNICENTVISHRKHLIRKFNAKNTAELIKKAIKAKVI